MIPETVGNLGGRVSAAVSGNCCWHPKYYLYLIGVRLWGTWWYWRKDSSFPENSLQPVGYIKGFIIWFFPSVSFCEYFLCVRHYGYLLIQTKNPQNSAAPSQCGASTPVPLLTDPMPCPISLHDPLTANLNAPSHRTVGLGASGRESSPLKSLESCIMALEHPSGLTAGF